MLRGHNDLDLYCAGSHPVSDTWVHGGPTRKNCVGRQVLIDVDVTLHDELKVVSWMPQDSMSKKEG